MRRRLTVERLLSVLGAVEGSIHLTTIPSNCSDSNNRWMICYSDCTDVDNILLQILSKTVGHALCIVMQCGKGTTRSSTICASGKTGEPRRERQVSARRADGRESGWSEVEISFPASNARTASTTSYHNKATFVNQT